MTRDRPLSIAVVGGYGQTGHRVARLLAADPGFRVTLVGRAPDRLAATAAAIEAATGATVSRVRAVAGDPAATGSVDLAEAFAGADLVLSATSQTGALAAIVAAATAAGADAMDIHLSSAPKWRVLRALEPTLTAAGRLHIADGGIHPGLPAVMIRAAAARFDLVRADVFGAFRLDWAALDLGSNAAADLAAMIRDFEPGAWRGGRWRTSWRNTARHDFGPPFGTAACLAMALEEMRALPATLPGLVDAGFFVAGFGAVVDRLAIPAASVLLACPGLEGLAGRLLLAALRRYGSGPAATVVDLDGVGRRDGRTGPITTGRIAARLVGGDAYDLTALAAVACIEQYRERRRAGERPTGLVTQAGFVAPDAFLDRLATGGARLAWTTAAGDQAG
jgi:saccharopine dehydrogenase (NAD+, L-lysine-forming)